MTATSRSSVVLLLLLALCVNGRKHHHHRRHHQRNSTLQGTDNGACASSGIAQGPGGAASCPTPTPDRQICPLTPCYLCLADSLWQCPAAQTNEWSGKCVTGSGGGNPLCPFDAKDDLQCCCPAKGCYVKPEFNWIIGTCQGRGCGDYFNQPELQTYKDTGSQLIINYVAAYQYDANNHKWIMSKDSSFNTEGQKGPYDTTKPNGGFTPEEAWMQPQPGGSYDWSWGYYPGGVSGIGPPGMLFVLSTEEAWNFAWYMLNKITLDRGPDKLYPDAFCTEGAGTNNNCWSAGNAGEIDFLEAPWTNPQGKTDDYSRLYATQWNQIGRWFTGNMGSTCNADGGWFAGDETSNNYFLGNHPNTTNPTPFVWAAVVDSVGTFIYRIPAHEVDDVWPGLSRKTASCELKDVRPAKRPPNNGPPCRGTGYCALFLPNCQNDKWGGAQAGKVGAANAGCKVNAQQGWCGNWWKLFNNTNQWLWPDNGHPSYTQFQSPAPPVKNPWNYEMEAWKEDWEGKPIYNAGCCVQGKGHCPTGQ